jgi:hypothetical protein
LNIPNILKKRMMKQIIRKASSGIFLLFWIDNSGEVFPDSLITLDFNPIIKAANLVKNFAICHYQARPKGLRRWGIFYDDDYFSVKKINSAIPYESILLDESDLVYPPNAVLIHRNCQLVLNQSEATLRSIF